MEINRLPLNGLSILGTTCSDRRETSEANTRHGTNREIEELHGEINTFGMFVSSGLSLLLAYGRQLRPASIKDLTLLRVENDERLASDGNTWKRQWTEMAREKSGNRKRRMFVLGFLKLFYKCKNLGHWRVVSR